MRRVMSLAVCVVALTLSAFASVEASWTFVPDRLNNPVYDGPSGLSGEATDTTVHIWGTNSSTPPGHWGEQLWPGLAAVHNVQFYAVTTESTVTLGGSGLGFANGIALWENRERYVIYGLNYGVDSGVYYVPSRWTALGGYPDPTVFPSWTALGGSISDPNGLHSYRLDYDGNTAQFWLDGMLLDALDYPMGSFTVRLVAYARSYGDAVDATFADISVFGTPIPEPSTILALLCGLGGLVAWRRR